MQFVFFLFFYYIELTILIEQQKYILYLYVNFKRIREIIILNHILHIQLLILNISIK